MLNVAVFRIIEQSLAFLEVTKGVPEERLS